MSGKSLFLNLRVELERALPAKNQSGFEINDRDSLYLAFARSRKRLEKKKERSCQIFKTGW